MGYNSQCGKNPIFLRYPMPEKRRIEYGYE